MKKGAQPFQQLLIETLTSVLALIRDKFSKKHLADFLRDLHAELVETGSGKDPYSDETTVSDSCYAICKRLQKLWNISIRSKDKRMAEMSALLYLVGQFHSFMDVASSRYGKILEVVTKFSLFKEF